MKRYADNIRASSAFLSNLNSFPASSSGVSKSNMASTNPSTQPHTFDFDRLLEILMNSLETEKDETEGSSKKRSPGSDRSEPSK